jgi:hypothetical protein
MWTPEQSQEAIATAKSIVPGIKTHSIPQGLQVCIASTPTLSARLTFPL